MRVHKAFQTLQESRMNSHKSPINTFRSSLFKQQIAHVGLEAAARQVGIS